MCKGKIISMSWTLVITPAIRFALIVSVLSLANFNAAHADPPIAMSHRVGNFTPASPNTLTLELRISNLGAFDLQNIRLTSTSGEISPDSSTDIQIGTLHAGSETTAYWTLSTPVSYSYISNGLPIFFRVTAHSSSNQHMTYSVSSMLRGN